MTYRFSSDGRGVVRVADGVFVSFDDADPNKPDFLRWLQDGNLPTPAEFTLEELQALHADAPIVPLDRGLEWFEDACVSEPREVAGRWVRLIEVVDLRADENLAQLKARLLARLADVRYQHETGGVEIAGAQVKTDRESQATIVGAYARAISDPATTVQWKADNGFVLLDAAAIKMFGGAVFSHVQGCFAREAKFTEQIELCTKLVDLLVLAEMIEEGW